MSKFKNCVRVNRNGKPMWRARLVLPFDSDLGRKPTPKDFYALTAAAADQKRSEYKIRVEKERVDQNTTLMAFVQDRFLPQQRALAKSGQLALSYYQRQQSQLKRHFLEPEDEALQKQPLRTVVTLGKILPGHIVAFFEAIKKSDISPEQHHRLKDDFHAILKAARGHIREPWQNYFTGVVVPPLPRAKKYTVFDPVQIYSTIQDDSKPAEDRALVAFAFILGLWPSEIFALQWDCIDLDAGRVLVTRRLQQDFYGTFRVRDGAKTADKGIRSLPMGKELTHLLKRLRAERTGKCLFYTKTMRAPYNTQNFKKNWPLVKMALGLPSRPQYKSLPQLRKFYADALGLNPEAESFVDELAIRMQATLEPNIGSTVVSLASKKRRKAA